MREGKDHCVLVSSAKDETQPAVASRFFYRSVLRPSE